MITSRVMRNVWRSLVSKCTAFALCWTIPCFTLNTYGMLGFITRKCYAFRGAATISSQRAMIAQIWVLHNNFRRYCQRLDCNSLNTYFRYIRISNIFVYFSYDHPNIKFFYSFFKCTFLLEIQTGLTPLLRKVRF